MRLKLISALLVIFCFSVYSEEEDIVIEDKVLPTGEELAQLKREEFHKELVSIIKNSVRYGAMMKDELGRYITNGRYRFKLTDKFENRSKTFSHVEYRLENGAFQPYTMPISFSEEGKYILHFRGVDQLGNYEEEHTYDITVDRTPPTLKYKLLGLSYVNDDKLYFRPGVKLDVKADDDVSGVFEILVNIEDKDRKEGEFKGQGNLPYKDSQKEFSEHGEQTLYLRAMDKVYNLSPKKEVRFFVDAKGPSRLSARVNPIMRDVDGKSYCVSNSIIYLSAEDNESGVFGIEYSTEPDKNWRDYKGRIQVPPYTDTFKIYYRAKDNLGNMSSVAEFQCNLDIVPPSSKIKVLTK